MSLFQHKHKKKKKNRPLYLNYSKKTGDIIPLRNTQNNDTYIAEFSFPNQFIPLLSLINIDEWLPLTREELGSSYLFNLEHKYLKSKDGSTLYLNVDKKTGNYRANKSKTDNKVSRAEFTQEEIDKIKKEISLDSYIQKGVI